MEGLYQDMEVGISVIDQVQCNTAAQEVEEEEEEALDIIEAVAVDVTTTDMKKTIDDTIDMIEEREASLHLIEWIDKVKEGGKDTTHLNLSKMIEVRLEVIVDHPPIEANQLVKKGAI